MTYTAVFFMNTGLDGLLLHGLDDLLCSALLYPDRTHEMDLRHPVP